MDLVSLLIKAMTYNYPSEIPVTVGFLPAAWKKYPKEIHEITKKYKQLFPNIPDDYDYTRNIPDSYHVGSFTDEWGCVWENVQEGMESIVTGHPVKTREDILKLDIPPNRDGRLPHGFMYLRLLDLRGFEEAMIDFAEEPPELQILINKVLEYNIYQVREAVKRADRIIRFGDDLGMQNGLAIGREKWIKYLKPCYKALYDICHENDLYVYMHTDGCIHEIMPDLKEAGVNMVNPQFRANGLDNLVRVCKGKIPICLDIDRQLLPFASRKDIADHIRECVEALYLPQGGLGLNLELGMDVDPDIMDAALEAVNKYRYYK